MTQATIAEYLHISQATYSRYESGGLDVPSTVLIKLADYYQVSIDYLLGQTDHPGRAGSKKHNRNSPGDISKAVPVMLLSHHD
ncbi:MAG: transcriptional regulator [Paenibacillaceae bacterium]|nr:transcriptional regulator [Paenibacillaceae bacterium]